MAGRGRLYLTTEEFELKLVWRMKEWIVIDYWKNKPDLVVQRVNKIWSSIEDLDQVYHVKVSGAKFLDSRMLNQPRDPAMVQLIQILYVFEF